MKQKNFSPYQLNISDSCNTALSVTASGKSIREKITTTYFPENSFYTLHYVVQGESDYICNGKTHHLSHGDILIVPSKSFCELTVTKAPYVNYWININGIEVARLFSHFNLNDAPIIKAKDNLSEIFEKIHSEQGPETYKQLMVLSYVYKILSAVFKNETKTQTIGYREYYIKKFTSFVEENYHNSNIRIPDIARHTGISSCQLYRIVMDEYGISPVKYLTAYRINMSKIILKKEELKISHIAKLCGFSDPLYFSRVFLKACGMPPGEYRKKSLVMGCKKT